MFLVWKQPRLSSVAVHIAAAEIYSIQEITVGATFFRTIWWRQQQQSLITTLVGFLQLFDGYFFRARHFTVLLTKKNSEKMESSKKVEEVALKSLS